MVSTTIQLTVDTVRVSTLASSTTVAATTADTILSKHDENPLVFNVPEVPTEVRGVFHKDTGVINYTALIEFVKNISSSTADNMRK